MIRTANLNHQVASARQEPTLPSTARLRCSSNSNNSNNNNSSSSNNNSNCIIPIICRLSATILTTPTITTTTWWCCSITQTCTTIISRLCTRSTIRTINWALATMLDTTTWASSTPLATTSSPVIEIWQNSERRKPIQSPGPKEKKTKKKEWRIKETNQKMAICPTTNFTALAFVSFHSSVCEYIINSSPSNKILYIYNNQPCDARVFYAWHFFFVSFEKKNKSTVCYDPPSNLHIQQWTKTKKKVKLKRRDDAILELQEVSRRKYICLCVFFFTQCFFVWNFCVKDIGNIEMTTRKSYSLKKTNINGRGELSENFIALPESGSSKTAGRFCPVT